MPIQEHQVRAFLGLQFLNRMDENHNPIGEIQCASSTAIKLTFIFLYSLLEKLCFQSFRRTRIKTYNPHTPYWSKAMSISRLRIPDVNEIALIPLLFNFPT